MLETMTTLILVIIGAVLVLFILAYGIYITFYSMAKTLGGGIEARKEHKALKEATEEEKTEEEKREVEERPPTAPH
ncbi:MAG: hypothetical protein JRI46_04450 [Deltaproteobacteria bacterium]|nr:hypothetical protein [Deltaproteobacteria bacterium]